MSTPAQSTFAPEERLLIESALPIAIIEHADDAIIAKMMDGTVATWNAGAERIFGYTAAEMIGGPITRLFPPDRLHEEGELLARLVLGKSISHFVTRRVRKDGAHIDVSITLSPVRDAFGKIIAVSKIARDVSTTHQRHLALAQSAAIVEQSDDAIISKSLDGTVISWNSGAARIFGFTADEMIGRPITRLFPAERLHEEFELIMQLSRGKKILHFVTQRLRKNGSTIDVSVTFSPIRDASGKIVAISKIARDITETYRRQLASALSVAIVEHSNDAIISKTLDGTVISWNLGAQEIFGYTAAEMIGGPIMRLFPGDRLEEEDALIGQVVLGKCVAHMVTRRIRKDGKCVDVSVTLLPVRDAQGQIVAICKIARDVTVARRRLIAPDLDAEILEHGARAAPSEVIPDDGAKLTLRQGRPSDTGSVGHFKRGRDTRAPANRALSDKIDELVRNEHRFQSLARLTSQVIWTNSCAGRMEGTQPGWSAFTGQTADDYQGFGWTAAIHPDDAQPTLDEWHRCVADHRPFLFEHRVRRHDGVYRTCTIHAMPVFNDDGTTREWIGVHNDISDRRQHEIEIQSQDAKFRFLAESLPQIVWTSRPDGWLDYYNQRWFSYTGKTLEQTQGWGWGAVLHPDDLENCIRVWNHSLQTGAPFEIEYRFRRASDGLYRWHLGLALALRDASGVILKWFGTSTDIHDYKEAESKNLALRAELEDRVQQRTVELETANRDLRVFSERLGQSNRELQDFASVASHDLQEPLRKVQTFGDRLKTQCAAALDEQGLDYLNRMMSAARRMQELVQDLLVFSRLNSRPRSFVAVDLGQVTREVLSDLEIRIAESGAQVDIGELPTIDADPMLIRQLLQNLIGNALKFHKKGQPPVVRIRAVPDSGSDSPGMCGLSVADEGIGFDEKYLDRIFAVFQRLHGRDEYEGTGVGLAICRKIARRHGGDITASSAPGHGSVFTVTLPFSSGDFR